MKSFPWRLLLFYGLGYLTAVIPGALKVMVLTMAICWWFIEWIEI